RHTRFSRDWSSDVCSSDLAAKRRADTARIALAEGDAGIEAVVGGDHLALAEVAALAHLAACLERAFSAHGAHAAAPLHHDEAVRSEGRRVGKDGRYRAAPR